MFSNIKKIEKTKNKTPKICFGSSLERNRLFPSNENQSKYPGPFEYQHISSLLKKYPNKTGYTLLASQTPRNKYPKNQNSAPPIGTYEINMSKPSKQCAKPFGIGAKLKPDLKNITPAPGTYTKFKREVRVCTAFGHDRIIVPMVNISCSPFNMAYCSKCEQTPVGDYWHKSSTNQDMCRPCMEDEWAKLKKCSTKILVRLRRKKELKMYTLMRNCDFFHEHNCTKAAIQKMQTKDLVKKLRMENYLSSYGL